MIHQQMPMRHQLRPSNAVVQGPSLESECQKYFKQMAIAVLSTMLVAHGYAPCRLGQVRASQPASGPGGGAGGAQALRAPRSARIAAYAPDMHLAAPRPRQAEPNTPKNLSPPASDGWPVAWSCMGCMDFVGFMGYIAWPAWPDFCCCQKTQKTQNLTKTQRNANPARARSAKRHWYQCMSRRPAIARGSFNLHLGVLYQHEHARAAG